MQKFEITKEGNTYYEVLAQHCTSDIARFIPGIHGVTENDVKIYMLDENLFEQAREKINDTVNYYCDHKPDGSIDVMKYDDPELGQSPSDTLEITVTATLKTWDDTYETIDGKKVYKL